MRQRFGTPHPPFAFLPRPVTGRTKTIWRHHANCGCLTPQMLEKAVMRVFTRLILLACLSLSSCYASAAEPERAKKLFNGRNLDGWKSEGEAVWEVEDGLLVGRQGPGNKPGDLFTTETYRDFELTVIYKVVWPANSGVWYRYQTPKRAYQADILRYKKPIAYSGSIYCPGKMFIAINKDPDIEKHDQWNTMVIRAKGKNHTIRLNGKVVASADDATTAEGRIGFQVHAGDEFRHMRIVVKEVRIQLL